MKRITIIVASFVVLAGMACAGPFGIFPVSPQGTFLLQSPNDTCAEFVFPTAANMNLHLHNPW